jgi:putative acetyltransferase
MMRASATISDWTDSIFEFLNQEYSTIKLETGVLQPEAIAFYKRFGYDEIERFGIYVDCEQSICLEKSLNL